MFNLQTEEENETEKQDQLDNAEKLAGTQHCTTDVEQAESAQSAAGSSDKQDDKQVIIISVLLLLFLPQKVHLNAYTFSIKVISRYMIQLCIAGLIRVYCLYIRAYVFSYKN